jgi:hypothetical protein
VREGGQLAASTRTGQRLNGEAVEIEHEFVNLTGHPLHLYQGGRRIRTIPEGGPVFRLAQPEVGEETIDGVEVVSVTCQAHGLPDPVPGRWIIVSQVAAMGLIVAGAARGDVLFPGPGVSDRGRVVGCRGLRWLVPTQADREV